MTKILKTYIELHRVAVHACNSSSWEAEAGGPWILSQSTIHGKTLSLKEGKLGREDRREEKIKMR